ncbi:MAG TPA: sensor histidine kinase [Phycisphaerales bacterium]|nr:sensor histidine kinase [Phycisphaerales bacterium]
MRLSGFIIANMENILQEWENFARSLGATTNGMDAEALRDHAELILRAIAADIETPQSSAQEQVKSTGHAPARPADLPESAATSHGTVRAGEGFSLSEMISEYRALRASVLRMWAKEVATPRPTPTLDSADDRIRFHEAIDEALADSVKTYSLAIEQMFAAKARRRMEALGTLTAGLSHDMANVLLPMRANLDSVIKVGYTPETAPLVESVRRAVDHLAGLTRGLRALSLDPDDVGTSPETTVLHEWWASAVSPFTWTLPRGVVLHVDGLSADTPLPPVHLPPYVLMQAVFNLVQNAAQALGTRRVANPSGKPRGNIWITAGLANALPPSGGAAGADGVLLCVRDDGPGMDPVTVRRCTEAFFTTKPKNVGSGLGLYLARNSVERHGGTLSVTSKLGVGTLFTLTLPTAPTPDAPGAPTQVAEAPLINTVAPRAAPAQPQSPGDQQ